MSTKVDGTFWAHADEGDNVGIDSSSFGACAAWQLLATVNSEALPDSLKPLITDLRTKRNGKLRLLAEFDKNDDPATIIESAVSGSPFFTYNHQRVLTCKTCGSWRLGEATAQSCLKLRTCVDLQAGVTGVRTTDCPKCGEDAPVRTVSKKWPSVLFVKLNRFDAEGAKLGTSVSVPKVLEVDEAPDVCNVGLAMDKMEEAGSAFASIKQRYKLIGVVQAQKGTHRNGQEYLPVCIRSGSWVRFPSKGDPSNAHAAPWQSSNNKFYLALFARQEEAFPLSEKLAGVSEPVTQAIHLLGTPKAAPPISTLPSQEPFLVSGSSQGKPRLMLFDSQPLLSKVTSTLKDAALLNSIDFLAPAYWYPAQTGTCPSGFYALAAAQALLSGSLPKALDRPTISSALDMLSEVDETMDLEQFILKKRATSKTIDADDADLSGFRKKVWLSFCNKRVKLASADVGGAFTEAHQLSANDVELVIHMLSRKFKCQLGFKNFNAFDSCAFVSRDYSKGAIQVLNCGSNHFVLVAMTPGGRDNRPVESPLDRLLRIQRSRAAEEKAEVQRQKAVAKEREQIKSLFVRTPNGYKCTVCEAAKERLLSASLRAQELYACNGILAAQESESRQFQTFLEHVGTRAHSIALNKEAKAKEAAPTPRQKPLPDTYYTATDKQKTALRNLFVNVKTIAEANAACRQFLTLIRADEEKGVDTLETHRSIKIFMEMLKTMSDCVSSMVLDDAKLSFATLKLDSTTMACLDLCLVYVRVLSRKTGTSPITSSEPSTFLVPTLSSTSTP